MWLRFYKAKNSYKSKEVLIKKTKWEAVAVTVEDPKVTVKVLVEENEPVDFTFFNYICS